MELKAVLKALIKHTLEQQGEHGLLVWYDPGGTLQSLIPDGIPDGVRTLQFEGSYLELRFRLENQDPSFSQSWLVYIPEKPPAESWLRDWELLGKRWEMDLLDLLNQQFNLPVTGTLRAMLRDHPENASELVHGWSKLIGDQTVTEGMLSEALLASAFGFSLWNLENTIFEIFQRSEIETGLSQHGLWRVLVEKIRLAGGWGAEFPHTEVKLRQHLQAALLLSELVSARRDLKPIFEAILPGDDHLSAFALMARHWREREDLRNFYTLAAEQIEREFELGQTLAADPSLLGIETFAGVDEALRLATTGSVAEDGSNYREQAHKIHKIAEQRSYYFWARQGKAGYWQPIQLAAKLYEGASAALERLENLHTLQDFISNYSAEEGWWQLDYAAIAAAAKAGLLREDERRRLLYPAWRLYGEFLDKVNRKFTESASQEGWHPDQLGFWAAHAGGSGRLAVIQADALRYDLAQNLVNLISEDRYTVTHSTMRGVIPSVTEIGMAALLPGAKHGFQVSVVNSKLHINIGDQEASNRNQRNSWLTEKLPQGSQIIPLEDIERADLRGISTLVILSREVDEFGTYVADIDPEGLLDLTERIRKTVRTLLEQGFDRVVITADHGFLYLPPGISPTTIPSPGAKVVKRRFAVGANPQGCLVLSSSQVGFDGEEIFAFPAGLTCFGLSGEIGAFLHGGLSLQESIIPVIQVKPATTYEKIGATMVLPESLTSRIAFIPVKAKNITLFSRPRKVLVEINGHVSQVIELSREQQSAMARVEWLGFSENPPDQVSVRLKDVDSLQVLDEIYIRVDIFI